MTHRARSVKRSYMGSSSRGGELPVAGVAEAGDDVGLVVQVRVEGGEVDGYIGVGGLQAFDAFRGGDEADEPEVIDSPAFEDVDAGDGRAAGGEHGIENDG